MSQGNSFNHEIRNPLFIARSLIETHLEKLDRAEPAEPDSAKATKSVLEKTTKQINRALQVVQRMTAMAQKKAEEGQAEHRRNVSNLKSVIECIIAAARKQRLLEGIHLWCSIPPDLPEVRMCQAEAREVFYNLIANAAQALTEQGGQLTIRAEVDPSDDSVIRVCVQDSGPGIPVAVLPYIFEPFYTTRAASGGNGFGLCIVKHLVERRGGTIRVRSHGHLGATFIVILPRADKDFPTANDISAGKGTARLPAGKAGHAPAFEGQ